MIRQRTSADRGQDIADAMNCQRYFKRLQAQGTSWAKPALDRAKARVCKNLTNHPIGTEMAIIVNTYIGPHELELCSTVRATCRQHGMAQMRDR